MARRMWVENDRLYRAVVEQVFDDGRVGVFVRGPYDTTAQAKAQITRASRWGSVTGRVESSAVLWSVAD